MAELNAGRDAVPTPWQLAMLRGKIRETAARFHHRLSFECIEDLMQEVLLRLWRSGAEDRLRDSPPYVRRVAENTTIDMLRRKSAKKRQIPAAMLLDTRIEPWQPPSTPEEILIAREEARQTLAANPDLRRRVQSAL